MNLNRLTSAIAAILMGCFGASALLGQQTSATTQTDSAATASLNFKEMVSTVPMKAKFIDEGFYIWGGSMVRDAEGVCHMLYARWPRELGHNAWVTHSEIAHAVSDDPLGPYRHIDIALPARGKEFWDGMCTHNPTVHHFDGKYYLYYMGNIGDGNPTKKLNPIHRNNQRIGVAVADHPAGPWKRFDKPVIDITDTPGAHDELMTSNPSILRRADGLYVLIYKAVSTTAGKAPFFGPVIHLAATSDSPTGPFEKQMKPLFTAPGVRFPAEDPYVWAEGDQCFAIVNDHKGHFNKTGEDSLALFTSDDGLDWQVAEHPWVLQRKIKWADGTEQALHRLERPQLWLENGVPKVLFCAAEETKEKVHSFNVHIPLSGGESKEKMKSGWEVLWDDKFDDTDNDSLMKRYYVPESHAGSWSIEEGHLVGKQIKSNHGSVIRADVDFADVDIEFDFQLRGTKRFNVVIDDKSEKTVHAGHICRASITTGKLLLSDDKEGWMNLKVQAQRKVKNPSAEQAADLQAIMDRTRKTVPVAIKQNKWHNFRLQIRGDQMKAFLDGKLVSSLRSAGIAHPTKRKCGFTVNGESVDFDNLLIRKPSGAER